MDLHSELKAIRKKVKGMAKEKKVIVYSTRTCPYCFKVKDYLKAKGVKFEEIDVGMDQAAAEEMVRKSGEIGVPQIEINGKIIVGYDPGAIDEALEE